MPFALLDIQRTDGKFQRFKMQIDSGAVVSLLRRSVADLLGLDLESGRPVELSSVTSGRTAAYVHELQTRFSDDLHVCVPFAIAVQEAVPNLIGRRGVFDLLQVDFDPSLRETRVMAPWLDEKGRRGWVFLLETAQHIERRWAQLELDDNARAAAIQLYNCASRLVVAIAGLVKLHRQHEVPILLRSLFEVAAQFEFLMIDPPAHGAQFVEFAHISRYTHAMDFVQNPQGPIARHVADSPLRQEGERRLRAQFDRVRHKWARGKKGRLWNKWYRKSVRGLADEIGWLNEYRLWYGTFSHWVHSDPSQLSHPGFPPPAALVYAYHYYARILLRCAEHGRMILTSDQYEVLKRLSGEFG